MTLLQLFEALDRQARMDTLRKELSQQNLEFMVGTILKEVAKALDES